MLHIRIIKLDVASFEFVCSPAIEVSAFTEQSFDILMAADGFEVHLATSHLGRCLLTNFIMDKLSPDG